MDSKRRHRKHQKAKLKEQLKSKTNMKAKNDNIKTLDQFKDQHYGKVGTAERDELESGFENFKIGAMIHEARIKKGLTQEELAIKVGTTKSYISKIENN